MNSLISLKRKLVCSIGYRMIRMLYEIKHFILKKYCLLPWVGARFEKIEEKVYAIEGLLLLGQDKWLFKAAKDLPDAATIVEIGGYKGRSTCALAFGCVGTKKHIFTIDTFNGNKVDFDVINRKNFFNEWRRNIEKNGLLDYVTPLVGFSSDISHTWTKPIDLLFIDGSHKYEDVLSDFDRFYQHVVPGGIVAMHDVEPRHPDCLRVWNERANFELTDTGAVSSLAFGRKPGKV